MLYQYDKRGKSDYVMKHDKIKPKDCPSLTLFQRELNEEEEKNICS